MKIINMAPKFRYCRHFLTLEEIEAEAARKQEREVIRKILEKGNLDPELLPCSGADLKSLTAGIIGLKGQQYGRSI